MEHTLRATFGTAGRMTQGAYGSHPENSLAFGMILISSDIYREINIRAILIRGLILVSSF